MSSRNWVVLSLAAALILIGQAGGWAQKTKRNKRMGLREGEVVTKAALEERYADSLKVGQDAPDFTLADPAGENEFRLSAYRGKPVVLMFGSLTCTPFRRKVAEVDKLYAEYKDRVEFRFIYIREAHPDSVLFVIEDRKESLQTVKQTAARDERGRNASLCTATLKLQMPVVIDGIDNQVNKTYAAWPIQLVIVDSEGKLAHISGPGPAGFDPSEVALWLKTNVK